MKVNGKPRFRDGAVRLSAVALPLALGVLPSAVTPAPAAAATRPAAAHGKSVKYYVVAPSVNGQPEFLYEIAQRTLGDGDRFGEIFDLNRGRLQPDGGRLTEPTQIEPGWVLLLPRDASGPDVRKGPLPEPPPPSPAPPQAPAQAPAGHTAPRTAARHTGTDPAVPLAGAGAAGVALAAGAVLFARRRRRAASPDGDRTGVARTEETTRFAADAEPPVPGEGFWPGELSGRREPSPPGAGFAPPVPERGFPRSERASVRPAGSASAWDVPPEPPGTEPWRGGHPEIVLRDVPPGTGTSATAPVPLVRDHDVYPAPPAPLTAYEVAFGDDLVTARVTADAALWRPLPHDAPAGRAVVCVGAAPAGCLFLDLATAPGPLAIDGPADAVERLAEAFVYQLATEPSGTSVALLGDVLLGLDGGSGVRRVPNLDAAAASASSDLVVVLLSAGQAATGGLFRGPFTGPRLIQVRLGAAEDATWSFGLAPDRAMRVWHGGGAQAARQF